MSTPLGNVISYAVLAALIIATAILFLFFSNRVRSVYSRIFPHEPKHFWSGRVPRVAAIRFVGVLMALNGILALAGSIYWASKL
jgi:hypothetical protein